MTQMNDATQQGDNAGMANAAGQLKDTAQQIGQQARDLGSQVRDQATQKYQQLRDQATEYYGQGRDSAMEWEQSLETYVRDQPVKAVLIAAGVGVVLGMLWKRS